MDIMRPGASSLVTDGYFSIDGWSYADERGSITTVLRLCYVPVLGGLKCVLTNQITSSEIPISTLLIFADQYFKYSSLGTHYSTFNNNIMSLYCIVYRYLKIISNHLPAIVCIHRTLSKVFPMVTLSLSHVYHLSHQQSSWVFLKYFIQLIILIFMFIKFRYMLNFYLFNVVVITIHSTIITWIHLSGVHEYFNFN